jgi:hypothetical protein
VKSERADTPPEKEETTATTELQQERVEIIQPTDRTLREEDPSPLDREEGNRADLLTGNREAHLSPLRENPEEMTDLDQEEGKGAS